MPKEISIVTLVPWGNILWRVFGMFTWDNTFEIHMNVNQLFHRLK